MRLPERCVVPKRVILDPKAGICGGVKRAISLAEKFLSGGKIVYALGHIIHNDREVERLNRIGLKTIHRDDLRGLSHLGGKHLDKCVVIIRAHGEPPSTFCELAKLGVRVIDGTCPVVTRSQRLARQYQRAGYQVAIVGKHNHPEIISIVGHTANRAVEIQFDSDLDKLKPGLPTFVMAQTTISPSVFRDMQRRIRSRIGEFEMADTICRFVVRREERLPRFARQADVILVVGGHKSSNTKMLHETCRKFNPRSHHVVTTDEIDPEWLSDAETIGVTGSASTPLWLLNEFVDTLNRWIARGRI